MFKIPLKDLNDKDFKEKFLEPVDELQDNILVTAENGARTILGSVCQRKWWILAGKEPHDIDPLIRELPGLGSSLISG